MSTREQLVRLLRIHGPLTAGEMVRLLDITPTAIRQHMDHLEAEGLVAATGLRRGRGRPRKVYALTAGADSLFPHAYDSLTLDLLESIARLPEGPQVLDRVLAMRRLMLTERYGPRLVGKPFGRQVAEVAAIFNEGGGLTDYAAQADGSYLLSKHNCNIATVAAQHPRFCQEERAWLQEILQTTVEARHSRATGDAACVFRILTPASATSTAPDCPVEEGG